MAKSFFIILLLCYISMTICYNFNYRILNNLNGEQSELISNNTTDSSSPSSNIDYCIPVRAVEELGCILSTRNILFNGLFQSVCEHHQICYACGFAHSITARQCNRLAMVRMYELCSQNTTLSFSNCLKQRFSAITLLRQYVYRPSSNSPGFFFECHQQCVVDYLHGE